MIRLEKLAKIRAEHRVLDGISLTVDPGEVAVVIGPSGGGKSTLLRCINALETFDEGVLSVGDITLEPTNGLPIAPERLQALRRRVGMVFQQFHLFPHLSVVENVMTGPLYVLKAPRSEAEEAARDMLNRVGMAHKANARPHELSGGQQQRVAIARALAVKPSVILFDEPTSALDPRSEAEVLGVMKQLAKDGLTMIVVTHDMDFARQAATSVHFLHAGQVLESAPPITFFDSPTHDAVRDFLRDETKGTP